MFRQVKLQRSPMSKNLIRKLIFKVDSDTFMHYTVGQKVWDGHSISDIEDLGDKFLVVIEKSGAAKPWRHIYKAIGAIAEFDLNFD